METSFTLHSHVFILVSMQRQCDTSNALACHVDTMHTDRDHYDDQPRRHLSLICDENFEEFGLDWHSKRPQTTLCHKCDRCDEKFLEAAELQRHSRTHIGEWSFDCKTCQLAFATADDLKTHLHIHTKTRPYKCVSCGRTFKRRKQIKCHEKIHSDEKPYGCLKCNKAFAQACHLKEHMRRHSDVKKYFCTGCSKKFVTKSQRKKHKCQPRDATEAASNTEVESKPLMVYGLPEKPFVCHFCYTPFASFVSLKTHFRTHSLDCRKNFR